MAVFNAEEWAKARKERRMTERLNKRQHKLKRQLSRNRSQFRADPAIQIELRRVANLCIKLGVHLNSALENEIVKRVMES